MLETAGVPSQLQTQPQFRSPLGLGFVTNGCAPIAVLVPRTFMAALVPAVPAVVWYSSCLAITMDAVLAG